MNGSRSLSRARDHLTDVTNVATEASGNFAGVLALDDQQNQATVAFGKRVEDLLDLQQQTALVLCRPQRLERRFGITAPQIAFAFARAHPPDDDEQPRGRIIRTRRSSKKTEHRLLRDIVRVSGSATPPQRQTASSEQQIRKIVAS